MLEGVVTSLLNQYLGQFLEGLDPEQLKISVWSGQVNLADVKVKPGALDFLHLPIAVKYGYVKRLHLSANWRHLSSQPVKVELSGVYVVAVPSAGAKVDTAVEIANALEAKLIKLQGLEDLRFASSEEEEEGASSSYTGKLATKIADNVEISVKDIHIRYEDFEGPHAPTSFGIALKELKAETTDENWKPMFQDKATKKSFKQVTLNSLFAYMNVNDRAGAKASSTASAQPKHPAAAAVEPLTVDSLLQDPTTAYFLKPVSGFVKLWMNKDTHPAPRFWVDSQLFDITLALNECQYVELLGLINRISASHSSMTSLMESFQEHFRTGTVDERRQYVDLYKRTLNAMWLDELTPEQQKRKEQLEKELRYEDISAYRLAAIAELKRELGLVSVTAAAASGQKLSKADRARAAVMLRADAKKLTSTFFSKLGVGKPKEVHPERVLTFGEREEIFANLAQEDAGQMEDLPPDYVHLELQFVLNTLGCSLCDRDNKPIAILLAEKTQVGLTMRDKSLSSVVTLGSIVMQDKYTRDTLYPDIIHNVERMKGAHSRTSSMDSWSVVSTPATPTSVVSQSSQAAVTAPSSPSESHVLQVEVHSPPLDASCDLRVLVRAKAPRIVIHQAFVDRMIKFFTPPEQIDWKVLSYSSDEVLALQGFSSLSLSESLQNHKSMDIALDVTAPTLIVPRDPTKPDSDVLVLDLGHIKIKSWLHPKQDQAAFCQKMTTMSAAGQARLTEEERARCYDVFSIGVKQVQMYLSSNAAMTSRTPSDATKTFLLNPFDVTSDLWLCMSTEVLNMPDVRVLADLPVIQFSLSNTKYTRLMQLVATFENVIALLTAPPDVGEQQEPTSLIESAQQTQQALIKRVKEAGLVAKPGHVEQQLDLAALTKMLRGDVVNAKALMAQIDADHSGTIDRAEFKAWLQKRQKARENNETLEVVLKLQSLALTLAEDSWTKERPSTHSTDLFDLRISNITFKMNQQTHQLRLGLVIGALSIADLTSRFASSKFIVNTASASDGGHKLVRGDHHCSLLEGDEFINVRMTTTTDASPHFAERPVELDFGVGFSEVVMCIEPESLYRLGVYGMNVFANNDAVSAAFANKSTAAAQASVAPKHSELPSYPKGEQQVTKPATKQKRNARINTNLVAHFASLKLRLFSKDALIAEAEMSNLHSELQLYSTGSLHVFASMREIHVHDRTPAGSKYPDIVTTRIAPTSPTHSKSAVEQDALVRVFYDTYSDKELDFPGHKEAAQGVIHGLQVTFLMRFVNELVNYTTTGQIAELLDFLAATSTSEGESELTDVTVSAAEMSQDYAKLAVERFIKLELALSDVDLIVPHHSKSDEYLRASIEKIAVGNALLTDASDGNSAYQQIVLTTEAFQIQSLIAAHGADLRPLVTLTPSKVVLNMLGHQQRIAVEADIQALTAALAPAQFHWLLSLLQLNLVESAAAVKPVRKRSRRTLARGLATKPGEASTELVASPSPPPTAPRKAIAPTAVVFQLHAALHTLAFTLTENRYDTAAQTGALASFQMSELVAGTKLLANGGMDLAVAVGAMSMNDISDAGSFIRGRPVLPEYRELLRVVRAIGDETPKGAPSQPKPPLSVTMNKTVDENGTGWSVIDVAVANFRFNLGPVLLRLPTFFVMPSEDEQLANAALVQSLSSGNASVGMPPSHPPTSAPQAPSYTVLKLNLANPVFQFVRDPTARVSEAILLTFGGKTELLMSSTAQQQVISAEFELNGFQAFTTQLDVSRSGFVQLHADSALSSVIIAPFGAHGTVKVTTPSDALDAVTILAPIEDDTLPLPLPVVRAAVVIDPIAVRLSYQTYRLALRTLEALSSATNEEEAKRLLDEQEKSALKDVRKATTVSKAPAGDKPSLPLNEQGQKDGQNGEVKSPAMLGVGATTELESQVKVSMTQVIPLFHAEELNIDLRRFDLALINDACRIDIPIARLQVEYITAVMHGFAHQRVWRASFEMTADYYNQTLVVWEPMLEQFKLNLDFTTTQILSTAEFNRTLEGTPQPSPAASTSALAPTDKADLTDSFSGAMLSNRLVVSSPGGLNLNVTHTMFRGVMDCLALFEVDPKSEDEARAIASRHASLLINGNRKQAAAATAGSTVGIVEQRHYQYRFENYTELTVSLFQQAAREASAPRSRSSSQELLQADRRLTVEPFTSLGFDFPEDIPLARHELSVRTSGCEYGALSFNVLLRLVSSKSFEITLDLEGKRKSRAVCEVYVQDGVRVIRLRGTVGVKNSTSFALELKCTGQPGDGLQCTFPVLQPGDEWFCPLQPSHISGGFLIACRPRQPESSDARIVMTSQFDWSSPIALMAERSQNHQYFEARAAATASAASIGATGEPTAVESLVRGGPTGDFNCSVYVRHLWSDGHDDTDDSPLLGSNPNAEYIGQVYVIAPMLLIQNLLAADVDVQLAEHVPATKKDIVHWHANIERGHREAVHALLKVQPTYLQLRIGSLQTQWSGLLALPTAPPEGRHIVTYPVSLFDAAKRELVVSVEMHLEGSMSLVLYVPFWVYDLTSLGLILSCDKKQTTPLGPIEEVRKRTSADERLPQMWSFPSNYTGKNKTVSLTTLQGVELARGWDDVQWSQPIGIDRVGLSTTTTVLGAPLKLLPTDKEPTLRGLNDIGVRVETASGLYHRTKLIHLTPHFVLISKLSCDLELMQRVSNNPSLVHSRSGDPPTFKLRAGEAKEYHWIDSVGNRSVCFRRVGATYEDWRWSGDLDPTAVGDVSIMVRHKFDAQRCWFVRAEIHVQGATVFVQLSEYDTQSLHSMLPYRIENHCVHQKIRIRQYIPAPGTKAAIVPVPQRDWLMVPSYSTLHFAPEVPIYGRPCQVEVQLGLNEREGAVVAERTMLVNLDEIGRTHGKVQVAPTLDDELGQAQTVFLFTESDMATPSTTVLRIANHGSSETFAAELRKDPKVTHKQIIARQREKRWRELLDAQANLQKRIAILRPKAGQAGAQQAQVQSSLDQNERILQSIVSEMRTMQDRQMISFDGRVLPIHLQNDVQFRLQLKHVEGIDRALAAMKVAGDVVCRVRSELTGKTASIFCHQFQPNDAQTNVPTSSSVGSAAVTKGVPTPLKELAVSWQQEVVLHIPEELLATRDEVVHLTFFFHPVDFATEDVAAPHVQLSKTEMKHDGFLRATKLRANAPPIALAHVSLPLADVPDQGSKADAESRLGTKTQRERKLIDWRHNRVPLHVDIHSYESEVWCTLSVVRLAAKSEENRSRFGVQVALPGLSLSLIDAEPAEVLFFSIKNTLFTFDDTLCTQDLALKIDKLQLDNQTTDALFPIVLGFSPVEPSEMQPMVQLSVAKRKSRSNIQIYEYASLLIQQLDVKVEEELIYTVIRFVNSFKNEDETQEETTATEEKLLTRRVSEFVQPQHIAESLLFFEFLQVQPIAVNVSFEAAPGLRTRMSRMKYNPMELILSAAGTTLGSIQSAPLRLNGRTYEHVRGSAPVIIGSLVEHYKAQAIGEAYKIVGSMSAFGNPVGAVNNMGTGLSEFFYLPAKGAVESPEAFGIGLAKGSLSLVKGLSSGIFNTVGSITGTVSKGLAMASLDDQFASSNANRQQNAPKNVAEGVLEGSKSLAGGIFKGVSGLVTDPYKGAKEGGAGGFFKGIGKGILGVVAKPTSGVVGFASQTMTGIGNTAEYLTDSKVHPQKSRPQRDIPPTGLQPFDYARALAHEKDAMILHSAAKKGKMAPKIDATQSAKRASK